MTLSETLLLRLSQEPGLLRPEPTYLEHNPLGLLCRLFPDFLKRIQGKSILDFGCGTGRQAIALVQSGASVVIGIDTNEAILLTARENAARAGISSRLLFTNELQSNLYGTFDYVISQNSMEHFLCPVDAITLMRAALNDGGSLLITFGPPWFAPYGSHMQFFTTVPWINLLFREKTVMKVRSRYRNDGATRYEQVESGLGKMTVKKFEDLLSKTGLKIHFLQYDCVKGLNFLSRVPGLRELFINHITCELRK